LSQPVRFAIWEGIRKSTEFESEAPGSGLLTCTATVNKSAATATDARNSFSEMKVAGLETPRTRTLDCETNPDPIISTIAMPLLTDRVEAEDIEGMGLRTLIEIDATNEESCELTHEIVAVPALIGAVKIPELEIVPTRGSPPAIPFTSQ